MPSYRFTIYNLDADLLRRLRAIGAERRESLNTTAVRHLREAVGIDERRERLNRYVVWGAAVLNESIAEIHRQRTIDERGWR